MNLGLGLRLGAGGGAVSEREPYLGLDGAPQFSLPGGIYDADTEVPLSVSLSHPSGGIRYSLDGGDISKTSLVYSSAISIVESIVLKAKAWTGRTFGPTGEHEYKILPSSAYMNNIVGVAASDELGWNSSDAINFGRTEV